MDRPSIIWAPHPDVTPEVEIAALANVYRFVLNKSAPGMTSTKGGDATMRNSKGVSHVDQQSN